jgi:Cysteine rich repeat
MKRSVYVRAYSRVAVIGALLMCASSCGPERAYPADPPKEPPKDGSSHAEQSPEEAAGGKHNLQLMRKACDEDVKKLCAEIRPGGGRILQCLRGQESNLSPACRQVLGTRSSNP